MNNQTKLLTKAEVSANTPLERLGHLDRVCDHIKYDHRASDSWTPERQEAIDEVKSAIKKAKLLFNNLEILKQA